MVCVGPSHALADFEKQDPEAALAAPLLEAWCDQRSALGEAGKDFSRDVFRFIGRDELSLWLNSIHAEILRFWSLS